MFCNPTGERGKANNTAWDFSSAAISRMFRDLWIFSRIIRHFYVLVLFIKREKCMYCRDVLHFLEFSGNTVHFYTRTKLFINYKTPPNKKITYLFCMRGLTYGQEILCLLLGNLKVGISLGFYFIDMKHLPQAFSHQRAFTEMGVEYILSVICCFPTDLD